MNIHIDIQAGIPVQAHSIMNVRGTGISTNEYSSFMDISLQLYMLLLISIWIYIDFYGYPCTDLLWILGPGG